MKHSLQLYKCELSEGRQGILQGDAQLVCVRKADQSTDYVLTVSMF